MSRPTKKRPLVLIDADPIVYRCGFAAETPYYEVFVQHVETEEVREYLFEPSDRKSAGDRMKAELEALGDKWQVVGKFRGAKAQPIGFALQAVKEQFKSIADACDAWLGERCATLLLLSGPGNYREKIATIRPYKGNRDKAHKPVHYDGIREYLVDTFGAYVTDGREADDEVSIIARRLQRERNPFVIATIDKDLDQIPGRHYNYMKHVRYVVDADEATAFFYQQCISGDPTDNIPGCFKVADVGATNIVNSVLVDAAAEGADAEATERMLWDNVVLAYQESKARAGCPYADVAAEAVALETARLVKLQEYPGQLWNPPGTPDELLP